MIALLKPWMSAKLEHGCANRRTCMLATNDHLLYLEEIQKPDSPPIQFKFTARQLCQMMEVFRLQIMTMMIQHQNLDTLLQNSKAQNWSIQSSIATPLEEFQEHLKVRGHKIITWTQSPRRHMRDMKAYQDSHHPHHPQMHRGLLPLLCGQTVSRLRLTAVGRR